MTEVVTFLLTDIEGSTTLWERRPEAMAAALAAHDALIARLVTGANGALLKTRGEGDSTFSVFRLPTDAVNAAARLSRALSSNEWTADLSLPVRIAVYTGEAEEREGDYFGTTVNRAARLRSLASGNQILVGASAAAVSGDGLPAGTVLVDLGPRTLPDLNRPERVFELRLQEATPAEPLDDSGSSSVEWIRRVMDVPFVGRSDEFHSLEEAWARAASGNRVLVLISGEPGIGKTRLAAEHARRVREAGGLVLYGRYDEEMLAPYQGFRHALADYARACPRSILSADLKNHRDEVGRLFPEVARRIGAIGEPARSDAEAERFRLFESMTVWLGAIASRRPVLLVLDDVQWADKPSLLLLQHLLRDDAPSPILLLGTFRDTDLGDSDLVRMLPSLQRGPDSIRMPVHGLSEPDVLELLELMTDRRIDEDTLDAARGLHRESAGNPFFLREIVRGLLDSDPRGGRLAQDVRELVVPDSVRDLVRSRVAALPAECGAVLTTASVIGQEFEASLLSTVTELDDDQFVNVIEAACRAGVIREASLDDVFAFSHAVVRRAVLDDVSGARRARVHRRIAEALEARSDVAAVAHHYCAAAGSGVADKAVLYSRLAGDRARAELAYESAVDHYRRALDVIDRYRPADELARCEVVLELGFACDAAGDYTSRDERLLEAAGMARRLGRYDLLARSALGYGGVLPAAVSPDSGAESLLKEVLDNVRDDRATRARALARLAQWLHYAAPHSRRRELADEAVAVARELDDPHTLAIVLLHRVWALDGPGDVLGDLDIADEVGGLGELIHDRELVLQSVRVRLGILFELGDFAEARDTAESLRLRAEELRHPEYVRLISMWNAVVAAIEGRYEELETEAAQLVARLQLIGHPQAALIYGVLRLPRRWLMGELGEDLTFILSMASRRRAPLGWRGLHAWALTELGQLDEARAVLDAITPGAVATMDPNYMWWCAGVGLANAAAALEDNEWCQAVYQALLPYSGRNCTLGLAAFLGAVDHHLGVLASALGRSEDAVRHFEAALERHEAMRARPFVALTQQALGAALRARGAPSDAGRANELEAAALRTAGALGLRTIEAQAGLRS